MVKLTLRIDYVVRGSKCVSIPEWVLPKKDVVDLTGEMADLISALPGMVDPESVRFTIIPEE